MSTFIARKKGSIKVFCHSHNYYEEEMSQFLAMPGNRRPPRARVLALLTGVRFWGGLSVLVALISLSLPWWGIETLPNDSPSWGAFWGSTQPALVTFSTDRLDQAFSANYAFIESLIVLTSLLAIVGSYVKRWPLLAIALLSSVVTDLFFIADIGVALDSECRGTLGAPPSCISGLVGSGTAGAGSVVTWGFKAGFYVFVISGVLILVALAIQKFDLSFQSESKDKQDVRRPKVN